MISNSLKGALLSGLVFPGLGQISLKHHKRGIALILTVSLSMVVIIVKAVQLSMQMLEEIMLKGRVINIKIISNTVTGALGSSDGLVFNLSLLLIVLCWIVGILDAYITGRKMDIKEQSTGQVSKINIH
jgi:TM2 domain-containing membrane protein YozV